MESLAIEMRTSVKCVACEELTPLAGLRAEATCLNCGAAIDVLAQHGSRGIAYTFGGHHDAVTEALAHGNGELHDSRTDATAPVRLKRAPLACACGGALPLPAQGRYVKCEACGDAVPVRWPDEVTRTWDARLHCVVGDAGALKPAKEPVLDGRIVKCKSCGGTLAFSGRRRALVCPHCSAANFIGDAAWTRLFHDHPFFLVYQLDTRVLSSVRAFLAGPAPGLVRSAKLGLEQKLGSAPTFTTIDQ